ncbi:MAG TPA: antibiotic biosynthesis monooxygenase [Lysobacter sp.]|nr:antibiotic biosynthesis monooxygenase [Lysobacter sp.]
MQEPPPHSESPRLLRVWTTGVRPGRLADYLAFANSRSLPMFRSMAGCEAVHFIRLGDTRQAVATVWADQAAIHACERSALYQRTVADLIATGVLEGDTAVAVVPLAGALAELWSALLDTPRRLGGFDDAEPLVL